MRFTCNRFGQLRVRKDQNLTYWVFRDTTPTVAFTEGEYLGLRWEHTIDPRYNAIYGSAVDSVYVDDDSGSFAVGSVFVMSPGQVPVQGVQSVDQGEQMVGGIMGWLELANREAARFEARLAQNDTNVTFELCGGNDIGLDPAAILPFSLDLGAAYAAQRGQTFTAQKFYPLRVSMEYNNEGFFNRVSVEAERYVAATYYALQYTP
jgi:hypothetical protein